LFHKQKGATVTKEELLEKLKAQTGGTQQTSINAILLVYLAASYFENGVETLETMPLEDRQQILKSVITGEY
jgi:hypothetical protein